MSKIRNGESGWLYAMIAPSVIGSDGRPLIKIGATTKSPHERAKQLSAATAAATPFQVLYAKQTSDVNAAEAEAHRILDQYRVNGNREFFEVSNLEACQTIDLICGGFSNLEPKTPWAELFASFPDDGEPRNLTAAEMGKCRELAKTLKNDDSTN